MIDPLGMDQGDDRPRSTLVEMTCVDCDLKQDVRAVETYGIVEYERSWCQDCGGLLE